jgi:hypothetical protein
MIDGGDAADPCVSPRTTTPRRVEKAAGWGIAICGAGAIVDHLPGAFLSLDAARPPVQAAESKAAPTARDPMREGLTAPNGFYAVI